MNFKELQEKIGPQDGQPRIAMCEITIAFGIGYLPANLFVIYCDENYKT